MRYGGLEGTYGGFGSVTATNSLTGGTITGTPAVYTVGVSAIPFIYLSSGSVAAGGGISAITALPLAYPSAYCWFPANALATTIAAGWYYCTFSTTTAGTAFLNTYAGTGAASIPSSPTAVTDGKGAFTSDTTSHAGPTIAVPANALGINGQLRIVATFQFNNTAGTKTPTISYGGSNLVATALTSQLFVKWLADLMNTGAAGKQEAHTMGLANSGLLTNVPALLTVDTTASQNVVMTLTKNTATDNLIMERYSIEVLYSS
jgi:hypothetical protein